MQPMTFRLAGSSEREKRMPFHHVKDCYGKVFLTLMLAFLGLTYGTQTIGQQQLSEMPSAPNVLMIVSDDLNHWVGHLGGHEQTQTPNIDALAERGMAFIHAYAPAPLCNPSRAAVLSGLRPHESGVYDNDTPFKKKIAPGLGIPAQFLAAGYEALGSGKINHGFKYFPEEWTIYYDGGQDNRHGTGVDVKNGFMTKRKTDLGNEDFGDWQTADWCIDKLAEERDKPFFLACGLFKPHEAFVAPEVFHQRFRPKQVKLPPYAEDDLNDIPEASFDATGQHGFKSFRNIRDKGRWNKVVANYLATISYADLNVGRILDALEGSAHADNTIVVFWGDHGLHMGEKSRFMKNTLWEEGTRTPLVWYVPWLNQPGARIDTPVDLMSIYPTLMELSGLPMPDHVSDRSIVPLLENPQRDWKHAAISTLGAGNHAVRKGPWRLIRYADGSRELYDHREDPFEWHNLADDPDLADTIARLERWIP